MADGGVNGREGKKEKRIRGERDRLSLGLSQFADHLHTYKKVRDEKTKAVI